MKFKFITKNELSRLPKNPGVYVFKNEKEILYIGKAANLKERVKNHFLQPTYRDNLFINQVTKIGYIKTDSEITALILEANLIKRYRPKYNIVWRDDKNYFYVGITKEDFPRVFITHRPAKKIKKSQIQKVKTEFIGPFVDGTALKKTLKILRKVFPYRSCHKIPNRPCLWYHLNRCPAPCLLKSKVAEQIPKLEREIRKEYQENIKNIIKILEAEKFQVLRDLKKEMKNASTGQDFETAGKIRDQIEALKRIMAHAKIFDAVDVKHLQMENRQAVQKIFQKILKTKRDISRIEAYDVSNIQGKEATGSMVTFINGQPDKNFYRRFKIKISGKPDDIAMIKEVLTRRFKHLEWGLPDLILIDGGIGQLKAVLKCKMQNAKCKMIKVASLAKKENKLYIEERKKPILLKTLPAEIFNLILQLRDEAHRFAIFYHRKLREKLN